MTTRHAVAQTREDIFFCGFKRDDFSSQVHLKKKSFLFIIIKAAPLKRMWRSKVYPDFESAPVKLFSTRATAEETDLKEL